MLTITPETLPAPGWLLVKELTNNTNIHGSVVVTTTAKQQHAVCRAKVVQFPEYEDPQDTSEFYPVVNDTVYFLRDHAILIGDDKWFVKKKNIIAYNKDAA